MNIKKKILIIILLTSITACGSGSSTNLDTNANEEDVGGEDLIDEDLVDEQLNPDLNTSLNISVVSQLLIPKPRNEFDLILVDQDYTCDDVFFANVVSSLESLTSISDFKFKSFNKLNAFKARIENNDGNYSLDQESFFEIPGDNFADLYRNTSNFGTIKDIVLTDEKMTGNIKVNFLHGVLDTDFDAEICNLPFNATNEQIQEAEDFIEDYNLCNRIDGLPMELNFDSNDHNFAFDKVVFSKVGVRQYESTTIDNEANTIILTNCSNENLVATIVTNKNGKKIIDSIVGVDENGDQLNISVENSSLEITSINNETSQGNFSMSYLINNTGETGVLSGSFSAPKLIL